MFARSWAGGYSMVQTTIWPVTFGHYSRTSMPAHYLPIASYPQFPPFDL